MSYIDDRRLFFELAQEANMVDGLADLARLFGRFRGASIVLKDGRSANYQIPENIRIKPFPVSKETTLQTKQKMRLIKN